MNFHEDIYNDIILNTENNESKEAFQDIIETNNILKDFMENQTIKSFTIDYLKTYILELREVLKLIDIYSNVDDNNLYNNFNNAQKFLVFNLLENPINNFIYPISKIEPKIKINDKFINIWNFKSKFFYKKLNKNNYKQVLLEYISNNDIELFHTYRITEIKELLIISLFEIIKNNLTIRKCKNCNKFFIPNL